MKTLALFTLLLSGTPALASSDGILARLELCQDEARIQAGFEPGENTNGVCSIRFIGSRLGTRNHPGLFVLWEYTCRFEGPQRGETRCK